MEKENHNNDVDVLQLINIFLKRKKFFFLGVLISTLTFMLGFTIFFVGKDEVKITYSPIYYNANIEDVGKIYKNINSKSGVQFAMNNKFFADRNLQECVAIFYTREKDYTSEKQAIDKTIFAVAVQYSISDAKNNIARFGSKQKLYSRWQKQVEVLQKSFENAPTITKQNVSSILNIRESDRLPDRSLAIDNLVFLVSMMDNKTAKSYLQRIDYVLTKQLTAFNEAIAIVEKSIIALNTLSLDNLEANKANIANDCIDIIEMQTRAINSAKITSHSFLIISKIVKIFLITLLVSILVFLTLVYFAEFFQNLSKRLKEKA